ncbi:MAG: energy transducer TonB [Rhizobacter sp.]|nr:energy transducer TonB [Ferruginibacter sp.]
MKSILVSLLLLVGLTAAAQDYKYKYYFDGDFNSVAADKAVMVGKGIMVNGLLRLDCFNILTGRMMTSAHFKDSSLTEFEGPFISYYRNGQKEKEGTYSNGIEWGVWQTCDSTGRLTDSMLFKKAAIVAFRMKEYYSNGNISIALAHDNRDTSFSITQYDTAGRKIAEIVSKEKNHTYNEYNLGKLVKTAPIKQEDYLPSITGGQKAWTAHVRNKLNSEVGIQNKAPEGEYKIMIRFKVTRSGELTDIVAETNHGYGMEEEAIRVIRMKPVWKPASINGTSINFLLRQPVTFVVQVN